MKNSKPTQTDAVLNHLKEHKGITSYEAFEKYGITRLSAKIYDLRANGYTIINREHETVNRYGTKVRYTEYRLVESEVAS